MPFPKKADREEETKARLIREERPHSDGPGPREISHRVWQEEQKSRKLTAGVQGGTLLPHTPKVTRLFPTTDYLGMTNSSISDR